MNPTLLFLLGLVFSATGLISSPVALLGGIAFALFLPHPFAAASRSLTHFLLQASVVLLGFGMNLHEVLRAGGHGFAYTALSIALALALGWALGRVLRVRPKAAFLITCGTAICGGSAIAALAPVTGAGEEDMAVSLGTVFSLNALALLLFPAIGWHFHLSQTQFGLWAALAVHDTSSVVSATARYGTQALAVGTAVKLARALWIVPVALVTAALLRNRPTAFAGPVDPPDRDAATAGSASAARVQIPWFIALFVLAAACRTLLPGLLPVYAPLTVAGKDGLTVVLYLIGTGLSRELLRKVGLRPMVQGVVLWIVVAGLSFTAIRAGWIAL